METTWAHELRRAGLRVTRPRLSVLSVLAEHPHADADTIVTGARDLHPSLSPQAVYGVLRALVDNGLARRFGVGGQAKTMVRGPSTITRSSTCQVTAWASTCRSTYRPTRRMSSTVAR